MGGINLCIFKGRAGSDPEFKTLGDGRALANLSIAVEEKWKDKDGHQQSQVDWVQLVCWGNTAKIVKKYVKKGALIFVQCRYKPNKYEEKDTGKKRERAQFVVDRIEFQNARNGSKGDDTSSPETESPPADVEDDIPF